MKKHISIMLVIIMTVCFSFSALAAPAAAVTVDVAFDTSQSAIIVSGIVTAQRANIGLTLEVEAPNGKIVYADQTVALFNDEGDIVYEFEPVVLQAKNPSGTYLFKVSGDRVGIAAPVSYEFEGADKQFDALVAVKSAIDNQSSTQLENALISKGITLGINFDAYADMENGKTVINALMLEKTYTVPADCASDENIDIVQASITQLRADFAEALVIGQFNDASDDADIEAWISAYGADFANDNPATNDVDESKLYPYIADALADNDKLAERIIKVITTTQVDTVDKIRTVLYEQSLLSIIENRHFSEGREIFEAFPTLFGINTASLSSLNETKKGEVYADAKGAYATLDDAGDAVNELISSYSGSSGGSGGTGGGGGGTGGGYNVKKDPVSDTNTNQPEQENTSVFNDMVNAEWAKEAVEELYKKGIIAGYGDGIFNPNNSITRAEFIKLLVEAIGVDTEKSGEEFADVNKDAWYRTYVNAARAAGLVNGDYYNCFNPNELITREDMAVMIYRCYGINGEISYPLDFADAGSVSEYAKEAVAFLNNKGIVNGVGNGKFAPKNTATRAQAAQIIYNILKISQ